jgi:exosortase A
VNLETKARTSAHVPPQPESYADTTPTEPLPDAATREASTRAAAWRNAWIVFGIAFVAVLALLWKTTAAMADIYWDNATFNHGFLILPIVGYLIWLRRDELEKLTPRPAPEALAFVAVSAFGWLFGNAAGVDLVEHFALLGILWSLFLGVFGWRIVKALAFPLFYAIFAVPFGDSFVPALQDVTAWMAIKGIELWGIPVYSDGILISIPPGNFEVAEACAGLRFLIATIALGFLFSYLTYRSYWRRAAFIVLCIVVPIIANGIRAWGIVFIGYQSDMQAAVGFDHLIYGWIFFAFITVLLLALGMTFRDAPVGQVNPPPVVPDQGTPAPLSRIAGVAIGAAVVVAAAPLYATQMHRAPSATPIALEPPTVANGWVLQPTYRDDWQPIFPSADKTILRSYVKNGRTIYLFIAYYRTQRDNAEVVNYNNQLYDGKTWMRVGSRSIPARIDGGTFPVEYTRMLRARSGRVALSWYWVNGRFTSDPYWSKLHQAAAKLLGGTKAAALVAVAADYGENPAEAGPVLQDFLASMEPLRPLLARAAAN